MSPHRTLKRNILRNLRDQPLHFLWAGAPTALAIVAYRVIGMPWATAAIVLCLASWAWIIVREWDQFPPHDSWDAPLDWSFYALGGAAGVVLGVLY